LGERINWAGLEAKLAPYYAANGAPSKPIRLMASLLLLKQMFNKSDEVAVADWVQSPYYQYFTDGIHFEWTMPCDPSDLVHFRKRIGEEGTRVIFSMGLSLHEEKITETGAAALITDTTVKCRFAFN
jgi:IS5 family transposase